MRLRLGMGAEWKRCDHNNVEELGEEAEEFFGAHSVFFNKFSDYPSLNSKKTQEFSVPNSASLKEYF